MDDGGSRNFLDSLKTEWKLLWASLSEKSAEGDSEVTDMNLPQLESLFRDLSHERHKLNVQLEETKVEIEQAEEKRAALMAVGGSVESVDLHLEHLRDQGRRLQDELGELNECLEEARDLNRHDLEFIG